MCVLPLRKVCLVQKMYIVILMKAKWNMSKNMRNWSKPMDTTFQTRCCNAGSNAANERKQN